MPPTSSWTDWPADERQGNVEPPSEINAALGGKWQGRDDELRSRHLPGNPFSTSHVPADTGTWEAMPGSTLIWVPPWAHGTLYMPVWIAVALHFPFLTVQIAHVRAKIAGITGAEVTVMLVHTPAPPGSPVVYDGNQDDSDALFLKEPTFDLDAHPELVGVESVLSWECMAEETVDGIRLHNNQFDPTDGAKHAHWSAGG